MMLRVAGKQEVQTVQTFANNDNHVAWAVDAQDIDPSVF